MDDPLKAKRDAAIEYLRERRKWVLEHAFIPSRGADVAETRRKYEEETNPKVRRVQAIK
jgi:hypothetical protein